MQEANTISVWNDGPGIPVEKHKTEKVWLPEMIFGQLLTGSNYDDDEKKVGSSSSPQQIRIEATVNGQRAWPSSGGWAQRLALDTTRACYPWQLWRCALANLSPARAILHSFTRSCNLGPVSAMSLH